MSAGRATISQGACGSGSATIPLSATSAAAVLLQAIEFVTDRGTKAPFDPQAKLYARVKKEAMARGLLVYPSGGTIDGARGDHVLIAPPFIVEAAQIDTIVERLGDAVDAVVSSVSNAAAN